MQTLSSNSKKGYKNKNEMSEDILAHFIHQKVLFTNFLNRWAIDGCELMRHYWFFAMKSETSGKQKKKINFNNGILK